MPFIVGKLFVEAWLRRAERGQVPIDDGDRFISLWIAFNGWMKCKFGEAVKDLTLINKVKKSDEMNPVFERLKTDQEFARLLHDLSRYTVSDMRYVNDLGKIKRYQGDFASLIDVLYQIRCNLFHGRKDMTDGDRDYELVKLAYRILLQLFIETLSSYPL